MKAIGIILLLLGVFTFTSSLSLSIFFLITGLVFLCISHSRKLSQDNSNIIISAKSKRKRAGKLPQIGNVEAICPYCSQLLEKKPGRKKKCPHCGEFIYVRTRPSDNQKILVTEEQTEMIEEQWSIVNGTHKEYIAQKENERRVIEKEKRALEKRFGREPSENDIQWSLLNKDLLIHSKNHDWGLFRNTKFSMGEMLRQESKAKQALSLYFEVCYLDLNGPNNMGGITDKELVKEFPAWNPKGDGMLAPGIIDRILKIINKLELDRVKSHELFISNANKLHKNLKLPVLPQTAWNKLVKELFDL